MEKIEKKQQRENSKDDLERRREEKRQWMVIRYSILAIILVIIFMPMISATEFDNIKFFDDKIRDYGKVTIRDWFGILSLAELELKVNTDICGSSCSMEMEIIMYQDGVLIDEVRFITLQGDGGRIEQPIKKYQFYIKTGEEEYDVDDYGYVEKQTLGNGTKVIEYIKIGTHKETRYLWEEYNLGEEVEEGNYYVRLQGNKEPKEIIDWQITSQGKLIDDWALWIGGDAPIAYFDFDKGDGIDVPNLVDATENLTTDGTWTETGIINNASEYDGTQHATIDSISLIPEGNENFTVSAWVNSDTWDDGNERAIVKWGTSNPGELMLLQYTSDGNGGIGVAFFGDDHNFPTVDLSGSWHHLVIVVGFENITFWLDGVSNGSQSTGTRAIDAAQNFSIGRFNPGSTRFFDGEIDEVGIWNRTLTSIEISDLYNNGLGLSFGEDAFKVILNSPIDNFISPINQVTFNCSAITGAGKTIRNISLWDNRTGTWVLNETEDFTVGGGLKNISIFIKNIADGTLDWTCRAFDSSGNSDSAWGNNRTLTIDTGAPLLSITVPTGKVHYGRQDFNISLNWTVIDASLDSCWYTYNNTNTTVVCLDLNTSVILQVDKQNITFFANDTVDNVASEFIEWEYLVFEISRVFNSTTIETSIESLELTVEVLSGFNIQQAQLIYNNTVFSGSNVVSIGAGIFNISNSITIPQGNSGFSAHNNTWFYNITIANDVFGNTTFFDTDFSKQQVNELSFGFCDQAGLDIAMLNFTYLNELTGIELNSSANRTTFQATFLIGLNADNLIKTISFNNISVNSSRYNFCTEDDTNRFVTNMQLFYTAEAFTEKNYFLNLAPLTNITNEINLFLIRDNVGIEFFIDVEQNLFPLTSAVISISKFFVGEGVFKTVEIDTTDGNGEITAFLDLNKDYRFTITKDGELLAILEKRAICDAAPCELTLSITDATPDIYSGFSDIFASQVLYNLSFDSVTKVVDFEFIDLTGLATSFRMDITKGSPNGTGKLLSTQRLFTSSGSLTFDASNESGDLTAKIFITRSPDQLIDFITFIISEVTEVLGILGLFVAFLIIITIIFGFAFSPPMLIMSIPLSLTLVKLMGIISLSNGALVVIYLLAIVATTFMSR